MGKARECLPARRFWHAGHRRAEAHCAQLARYFWIGWEGAVLRSRMEHAPEPLDLFTTFYMAQAATSLGVRPPACQPPATPRVSPAQPAPGQTAQAAN
ncbi:TetR family transcriptional regulator C-terminal domain-containing protein [Komagataeibacter nataicola]|nr:TetR family transcriptional regulator C-terminal domain-containing protein [Komagataeibacter nataicola]WNM08104.1 TetR family transcriptional regulator C-terminal domain-containing protein [Komagataeibacter nataicola]